MKTMNKNRNCQGTEEDEFNLLKEASKLFHVSLPSVVTQFNLYFIFPQSASLVGRMLGTEELGAFSLGSLVGNLTCLSVMVGVLSAADTLMPRAYGRNDFQELGRLSLRAVVACCTLLAPAVICLSQKDFMVYVFTFIGQDALASKLAAKNWIPIFLWGVPANMIFRVFQRFYAAQHKPWPAAFASLIPTFVLHPLYLKALVSSRGLEGSAYAIVVTQWSTLVFLLLQLYMNRTHEMDMLPEVFSIPYWKKVLAVEPLGQFLHLSLGGVVSLSEWWFWETMCFVAGSFGVVAFCAHTIAYNLIPLAFMIVLGTQIGLSVRMGTLLALRKVDHAKRLASWTLACIACFGIMSGLLLHLFRREIVLIFSNDLDVMQTTLAIWPMVCYYIFVLYIFGINSAIIRTLGMQWRMAVILFATLWLVTLPLVFYFAVRKNGGLICQWTILPAAYTFMQFWLMFTYSSQNWEQASDQAKPLATRSDTIISEESTLLDKIDY